MHEFSGTEIGPLKHKGRPGCTERLLLTLAFEREGRSLLTGRIAS